MGGVREEGPGVQSSLLYCKRLEFVYTLYSANLYTTYINYENKEVPELRTISANYRGLVGPRHRPLLQFSVNGCFLGQRSQSDCVTFGGEEAAGEAAVDRVHCTYVRKRELLEARVGRKNDVLQVDLFAVICPRPSQARNATLKHTHTRAQHNICIIVHSVTRMFS